MVTGLLGRITWYELLTKDIAAARRFYPGVTGWRAEVSEGADPPYATWLRGDRPVGAVMAFTEDMVAERVPPHWGMYVATPDILHTCRHAEQLGGKVCVPPTMIPDAGRMAVLLDPQGAQVKVLQSLRPPLLAEAVPQVGDFAWHELATAEAEAALRFYGTLFGWERTTTTDMGPMGLYRCFGRHGRELGGVYDQPRGAALPPHWLLYVRVGDLVAALAQVKARGGRVLNGPVEVAGGSHVATCLDPQGAPFALHQAK